MESPRQPIEEPQKNNGLLINIVPEQGRKCHSHDHGDQVRELSHTAEYITLGEHIAQYITHHIGSV